MNVTLEDYSKNKFYTFTPKKPGHADEINSRQTAIRLHKSVVDQVRLRQAIYFEGNTEASKICTKFINENLFAIKEFLSFNDIGFYTATEIIESMENDMHDLLRYRYPSATPSEIESLILANLPDKLDVFSHLLSAEGIDTNESVILRCSGQFDPENPDYYIFHYYRLTPNCEDYPFELLLSVYPLLLKAPLKCSLEVPEYKTVDDKFELESKELIEEIRVRVEKLRQFGVNDIILSSLFKPAVELSRLRITKRFQIFLPDFNNLEIKMSPLPKAVFLLFLRHEEGITFKCLGDYTEELNRIYQKITARSDKDAINDSILAITDPTNNSINEKCARIREAYVQHFDERIAQNYFVTGSRGEPKKITLPRHLVEYECQL